jgi:glutamate-ammonia-ligase adenylyltransferase
MNNFEHILAGLPDPTAAQRFLETFSSARPADSAKLFRNNGLLSDVLTLTAYSPLLAATLLQNPEHISWLDRKRRGPAIRTKEELLEALGRFVLTHSQLDLHAQLARFRRRELLRIFLSDIRRLTTIAEITEDISNLADAILETALRKAEQDTNNRFGPPLAVDKKGRKTTAQFCVVSLGKLGSRELNYSSDIDLLFLYSAEGETSGSGTKGSVTNREYFTRLSESILQLVGKQTGEGAAYRVDMRLRPHGRVGPLAISVDDAVRYYTGEARDWERQVLIRSRGSAGEADLYRSFFTRVETAVFSPDVTIEVALENVRRSKQLIDIEQRAASGFNVKLGRGGIREIEFIAQALQLAHGGRDRWLRASHTLISLSRLADRGHINEAELTELFNAYEFLRHLEHVLQMENGLQTHAVPDDAARRDLVARRMRFETTRDFDAELEQHRGNVHRVFERVFGREITDVAPEPEGASSSDAIFLSDGVSNSGPVTRWSSRQRRETGPPPLKGSDGKQLAGPDWQITREKYVELLRSAISADADFRHRLGSFRRRWAELIFDIKSSELAGHLDMRAAKRAQTALAEASIDIALELTRGELADRYRAKLPTSPIAVIGLGKLGGRAVDYGSDLDLVLVYDARREIPSMQTAAEFYSRAAELFVTALSSMTRDGSIYRVDLRLRPYGKNGQSVISSTAFIDYMRDSADIWEWLAYVKVRAVAGDDELARTVEKTIRETIHARAGAAEVSELASETRRVRQLLEKEKSGGRRAKDIDIKYGTGGLLDVYFAMRYLQLRDNVPDRSDDRSTEFTLNELARLGSLSPADHKSFLHGYRFLSELDHNLRLTVGRTTRLPLANHATLQIVSRRMNLSSVSELLEQLTLHRLNNRAAFDNVLGSAL